MYTIMSWNKDHGGAGHICGTSLKTYFLIMDANSTSGLIIRPNGRAGRYFGQPAKYVTLYFFPLQISSSLFHPTAS